MILLFGYGDDDALTLTQEAAEQLGVPHLLADQRRIDELSLTVRMVDEGATGELRVGKSSIPLAAIDGVYARPLAPVAGADPGSLDRAHALSEALTGWLDATSARVVSRPSAMASNGSKPYQAQRIAGSGFLVPETLVSSSPDEVRAFWRIHGEVIFKSTSGIRSIVRRLDETAARSLDRLAHLPTQFQALVPGVDVRVHVIADEVCATEIRSRAVDYRYACRDGIETELVPCTLPEPVARRCVTLARDLGLPLAGIDLRRRPDDEYVCFEVNPMPGFSYYQAHTGQPIATHLVRYLAGIGN